MKTDSSTFVDNNEQVARILHQEWVVDGEMQANAFALTVGETYLSVNRLSVNTFYSDVRDFVSKHPAYRASEKFDSCYLATLNVGEIRSMEVSFREKVANLTVEVEPRDVHYKSHAGIFTRIEGKNIKGGQNAEIMNDEGHVVSYEAILLKVQHHLLALAELEKYKVISEQ